MCVCVCVCACVRACVCVCVCVCVCFCFALFVVLLLYFVDHVKHCGYLVVEEEASCFSLVCDLCIVCHGLFALPLGIIGRL